MSIVILTPPATEPVSVAEAKLHCRVDHSDEDALFARLIEAAREAVEVVTGLALISRRVRQSVRDRVDAVTLEVGPLRSLVQVRSLADASIVGTTRYEAIAQGYRSRLAWRGSPPSSPLEIDYDCGFADAASGVPAALRQATLEIVAQRYLDREGSSAPAPRTLSLLAPFVSVRL